MLFSNSWVEVGEERTGGRGGMSGWMGEQQFIFLRPRHSQPERGRGRGRKRESWESRQGVCQFPKDEGRRKALNSSLCL